MASSDAIFEKGVNDNEHRTFRNRPELGIHAQYKQYRLNIKQIEVYLLDNITELENSRKALCSQLFLNPRYKKYFFDGSNLDFEHLLEFTDIKSHVNFDFKAWVKAENVRISIDLGVNFINYAKDRLFEFIILNIRIKRFTSQLVKLRKKVISFKVYKAIVKMYNKRLVDLLIEKHYSFTVGHGLSKIKVVKQKITPRRLLDGTYAFPMHFPETEKRRKECLAKGLVPFHKELFPDGRHYFVYITEGYCLWFHWYKGFCFLPNRKHYKFTIVRGSSPAHLKYLEKTSDGLRKASYKDLPPKLKLWWLKKFKPEVVEKFPTYYYKDLVLEENILLRGYTTYLNPDDIPLVTNVKNNEYYITGVNTVLKELREKRKKEQEVKLEVKTPEPVEPIEQLDHIL